MSICKHCLRAKADADRLAREAIRRAHEARTAASLPLKKCVSCKKQKGVDCFAVFRRAKDGLRRSCKECVAKGKAKTTARTAKKAADEKRHRSTPEKRIVNLQAVTLWQMRNREACNARQAVHKAVKAATLKAKPICEIAGCKQPSANAHHNTYVKAKRLKVVWCCDAHHRRVHAGERLKTKAGCAYKSAYAPETY